MFGIYHWQQNVCWGRRGKAFPAGFELWGCSGVPDLLYSALILSPVHLQTSNAEEMPESSILLTCWPVVKYKVKYLSQRLFRSRKCTLISNAQMSCSCNAAEETFTAAEQSWCLVLLCVSLSTVVLQRGWNLVSYTHCLSSWHINIMKEMIM